MNALEPEPITRSLLIQALGLIAAPCRQRRTVDEMGDEAMPNYVLVVEESPVLRELCISQLENCGFEVHVAEDEQSALTATAAGEYSFIFMGLKSKESEGLEALRAIRACETRK